MERVRLKRWNEAREAQLSVSQLGDTDPGSSSLACQGARHGVNCFVWSSPSELLMMAAQLPSPSSHIRDSDMTSRVTQLSPVNSQHHER